jgi:tripartite-type tricarboxylate transporter receptor subunit TctC
VFSSGIALSKSLLKSMPFDPATAFAPISIMAQFDLLVLVQAGSPLRTLQQALDAARADPQVFNVGTINPSSTQNVTGELLRSIAGIPIPGGGARRLRFVSAAEQAECIPMRGTDIEDHQVRKAARQRDCDHYVSER